MVVRQQLAEQVVVFGYKGGGALVAEPLFKIGRSDKVGEQTDLKNTVAIQGYASGNEGTDQNCKRKSFSMRDAPVAPPSVVGRERVDQGGGDRGDGNELVGVEGVQGGGRLIRLA